MTKLVIGLVGLWMSTWFKKRKRWIEWIITWDPDAAYWYALKRGPFPAGEFKGGERIISSCADCAYYYALNVIEGPFPAGEKAIAEDPKLSYLYSVEILKSPFVDGEPSIKKSRYRQRLYNQFLKRWCQENKRFISDLKKHL